MSRPGPHPPPPLDLHTRRLPLVEVHGPFWRVHRADREVLFFGRTGANRFDAPAGEFGVLYLGESEACAFIETFGASTGVRAVSRGELARRRMAQVQLRRPVRVVELDGPALARLGADARLLSADHSVAQTWARALHDHPAQPCGMRYRARHDTHEFSVAIFERCSPEVATGASWRMDARAYAVRLAGLLDRYEFALL